MVIAPRERNKKYPYPLGLGTTIQIPQVNNHFGIDPSDIITIIYKMLNQYGGQYYPGYITFDIARQWQITWSLTKVGDALYK